MFFSYSSEFLPKPPVGTHVVDGSVTWHSAEIDWDEPSSFSAGDYYTVAWKQDSKTSYNWTAVSISVLCDNDTDISGKIKLLEYKYVFKYR